MATTANQIATTVKVLEQSALGSSETASSQLLRRTGFTMDLTSQTYSNNEIVAHQMSTGDTDGIPATSGKLDDVLSAGSFTIPFGNLLRKAYAATAAITALGVTIAGSGPTYTLTRTGSWITDGIKIGDVIQLSVGTLNAANISKNLQVVGLTATVATVIPVNGVALVAEGPITGCTVTVMGKKVWTPTTGHLNKYLSFEKWFSDISKSELFRDCKVAQAAVTIPGTGLATVSFDIAGLGGRTRGTSEVLTSPTAATTTAALGTAQGRIVVNGVSTPITQGNFTINGNVAPGAPEVGSPTISDHVRGAIEVKGTITTKFTDTVLQAIREAQSVVTLMFTLADTSAAGAAFISFVIPAAKLFTDAAVDAAEVTRSYNWTGQYSGAGTGVATQDTIIVIQDSAAP